MWKILHKVFGWDYVLIRWNGEHKVRRVRTLKNCDRYVVQGGEFFFLNEDGSTTEGRDYKPLTWDLEDENVRLKEGITGETSDGYHTFNELYEYRMLYNAHAAHGWLAAGIPVVKSWRHSDGEKCFGGGWFIVSAHLPTGQVSNHYEAGYWDMFQVPEVDLPPEYDGHTPKDAAVRLRKALAAEEGEKG
jgi:hypothetical protein